MPEPRSSPAPSCAVLVISSDGYRDLWRPFFTLFWRYWPDCPFPVYLGTNRAQYDEPRVTTLAAGADPWSKQLRLCLNRIDDEYVLLLLEDYFLNKPVSSAAIIEHLKLLHALRGTVLRLYPKPGPDLPVPGRAGVGRIHPRARYRISTQAALWSRIELLSLLEDEESPWDFERNGTTRSQAKPEGFYAACKPALSYRHVVERGRWFRSAARYYERQQIGCDFQARPVMGLLTALKKAVNRSRKTCINALSHLRVSPPAVRASPLTLQNSARPSNLRLVFLTNIIAPYWKSIFDALSGRYSNMRVLLSARTERNRHWDVNWQGLDVVVQKTITITRRWRHPKGFTEPVYLHLPLDTVRQLRSFEAEVVVSNEMGFRTLLALAYRKRRPSSRLIVWADLAESTEQGRGCMRSFLRRFLANRVDGFVVLGNSGARYLRTLGTDDRKIFRIPYTTDISRFASVPLTRAEERARRLLYVGQLVQRKGLLPFITVLSRWAAANPDHSVEFVLAGDGVLRHTIEQQTAPANLLLTFLGDISYADLPRVYAESGIFAFPTLADTWGVVVNEALASGLPVLGSVYSQAVEELVEDGRTGWTFRPDNAGEMYQAIDRTMNTPLAALNDMRQHARSRAIELTPDYVATRIDDVVRGFAGTN